MGMKVTDLGELTAIVGLAANTYVVYGMLN